MYQKAKRKKYIVLPIIKSLFEEMPLVSDFKTRAQLLNFWKQGSKNDYHNKDLKYFENKFLQTNIIKKSTQRYSLISWILEVRAAIFESFNCSSYSSFLIFISRIYFSYSYFNRFSQLLDSLLFFDQNLSVNLWL